MDLFASIGGLQGFAGLSLLVIGAAAAVLYKTKPKSAPQVQTKPDAQTMSVGPEGQAQSTQQPQPQTEKNGLLEMVPEIKVPYTNRDGSKIVYTYRACDIEFIRAPATIEITPLPQGIAVKRPEQVQQ